MKNMVIANGVSIGWFGRPGGAPGGKTHLTNVSDDNVPLCGTRLSPDAQFQWCFPTWRDGDPECERCKEIKHRMWMDYTATLTAKLLMKEKKTNMKVHYSSATNEWSTPIPLYLYFHSIYRFTLDPCCTLETRLCRNHFTQADDGLKQSWANERVWMNPPYGREIGKWVQKAYEESLKDATVCCLIPARTDTKWWKDCCLRADNILFLTGRVKFLENGHALKAGAPFPSAVVTFRPPNIKRQLECYWRDTNKIMDSYHTTSRKDLHLDQV